MSWESWLKDKMDRRKYPHKDQAIKDVANALRKYSDLKPEIARFDPGNGRPDEFISCVGTIPVRYRDKVYNIPIRILLLASHPFQPPVVYVKPTSNMVIKPGKHVDICGRVYLPYLTDWRSPSSDLYELIQILCLVFGDDPPVFAKAGQAPGRPPPPNLGGQQFYQGTPYPTSQSASMPMPNMQPGGYYPPTSLPYPGSNSLPPYPTTQAGLPPYPAAAHPYPPTTNYPASNSQPQQQQQQQQQPSVTPYPRTTSAYPPPKSTSTVQRDGDNQTFQARSAPTRQGSVMDPEVVKMSMLSSVEDKLKKRVNEVFEQGKQELDDLTNTNTELKQRGQQLSRTVERLEQDEKMAMSNVEMLTKKERRASRPIDEATKRHGEYAN